ncbi:MAG: DMT family transporter [Candidatus Delongbacteria bacterium]|jgi:drug/metabolite transporter (DMT)-like permease|nr:DMT family transporter [Candidatus Delongbacteria bacterium]
MELKNKQAFGALLICIAATLWGLDGIVLTPRLYNLDTQLVVFMLHAIPFLLFNIFLFKEYKTIKKFTRYDILYFLLLSLFGGALGTLAIVKALFLVNFQHLTVVILLQKLQPVFAIALASILLKEKLHAKFVFWGIVAITGGYFLTFGTHLPNFDTDSNTILAALYSILAAISFGSSTVFSKKLLKKFDFKTTAFYRYGFTSIIMLIIVLINGKLAMVPDITNMNWLIFSIIALTSGSGAILLYNYGLNNVKAMVATICELCFPISAIIFDYFVNGKMISPVQWISAIIMIIAIIRLNKTGSKINLQK